MYYTYNKCDGFSPLNIWNYSSRFIKFTYIIRAWNFKLLVNRFEFQSYLKFKLMDLFLSKNDVHVNFGLNMKVP